MLARDGIDRAGPGRSRHHLRGHGRAAFLGRQLLRLRPAALDRWGRELDSARREHLRHEQRRRARLEGDRGPADGRLDDRYDGLHVQQFRCAPFHRFGRDLDARAGRHRDGPGGTPDGGAHALRGDRQHGRQRGDGRLQD